MVSCTLDGPTDWTQRHFVFVAPQDAHLARLSFSVTAPAGAASSASMDDLSVLREKHVYANMLRHSSFEAGESGRPIQYWGRFLDYMRHDERCGKLDASVAFHGSKSLRLDPGDSYSFWKELRQVDRGNRSRYRFACSAWLKAKEEGAAATLAVNGWAEDNWNRSHFKTLPVNPARQWTRHALNAEVESGLLEIKIANTGKRTVWVDAAQLCEGWEPRPYCDAYYGSHGEELWDKAEPRTRRTRRVRTRIPERMPICPAVVNEPNIDGNLSDRAWKSGKRRTDF